jgi:hypothetical protein
MASKEVAFSMRTSPLGRWWLMRAGGPSGALAPAVQPQHQRSTIQMSTRMIMVRKVPLKLASITLMGSGQR